MESKKLIWSKYNFLINLEKEDRYFIYNSYTNDLMELSHEYWRKMQEIRQGEREIDDDFLKELKEECILNYYIKKLSYLV